VSQVLLIAMFVLAPALVLAQLPVKARRYFLAAAATALLAYAVLMGPGLGGGALLVFPLALMGIIAAALLIEAVALVRRLLGGKGRPAAHG
jgi:predicted anti-sigma-YlaC factor YlaD